MNGPQQILTHKSRPIRSVNRSRAAQWHVSRDTLGNGGDVPSWREMDQAIKEHEQILAKLGGPGNAKNDGGTKSG